MEWLWAFYPPLQLSLLMFQDKELQVTKIWAGKHWLELSRLYVTVVHSQSVIYTKYKIHYPYILTDACFTSTLFVWTRKESCLPVN